MINIAEIKGKPTVLPTDQDFYIALPKEGSATVPVDFERGYSNEIIILPDGNNSVASFSFDVSHRELKSKPRGRNKSILWEVRMSFEEIPILGAMWVKTVYIRNRCDSTQELNLHFTVMP